MTINGYNDFIAAVNGQPDPSRLLFVFAESRLPPQHTESERQRFQAGQGGTLTPVMCVDKLPAELPGFSDLVDESCLTGQAWNVVFAAALDGQGGAAPTSASAEQALRKMIDAIERGAIGNFLPFNRDGELLHLS